jgi:hypothetical protein
VVEVATGEPQQRQPQCHLRVLHRRHCQPHAHPLNPLQCLQPHQPHQPPPLPQPQENECISSTSRPPHAPMRCAPTATESVVSGLPPSPKVHDSPPSFTESIHPSLLPLSLALLLLLSCSLYISHLSHSQCRSPLTTTAAAASYRHHVHTASLLMIVVLCWLSLSLSLSFVKQNTSTQTDKQTELRIEWCDCVSARLVWFVRFVLILCLSLCGRCTSSGANHHHHNRNHHNSSDPTCVRL